MDLNNELLKKIIEFNNCKQISKDINSKLTSNQLSDDIITKNAIDSLCILNELYELEPNVKIRNLHYLYLDNLEKENYIDCHNIVYELKKIN